MKNSFENKLTDGKKIVGVQASSMLRGGSEFESNGFNGETFQYRSKYISKSGEPYFVKLYLQDAITLSELDILKTSIKGNVLYRMLQYIDANNEIRLDRGCKDVICNDCGVTKENLKKILAGFVSAQVLFQKLDNEGKPIRGSYLANPYLFGYGKWEDVFQLRLSITYDKDKRRFIEVERNPEKQLSLDLQDEMQRNAM